MIHRRAHAVLVPVLSLLAGCGGRAFGDGAGPVSSGDAGTDAPLGPECPAAAPADRSACTTEGMKCEYGSDARWVCDTVTYCFRGAWQTITPATNSDCPTPPNDPSYCPATRAAVPAGSTCTAPARACEYPEGYCACLQVQGPPIRDAGPPGTVWQCGSPAPACPGVRPRIGTACATPDQFCDYSACGIPSGAAFRCDTTTGYWTDALVVCGGAQGGGR